MGVLYPSRAQLQVLCHPWAASPKPSLILGLVQGQGAPWKAVNAAPIIGPMSGKGPAHARVSFLITSAFLLTVSHLMSLSHTHIPEAASYL